MPISVEPVKLKPLFGMEPGLYLTILYVLIILGVVFLVAFLPGIIKGGKRVTFVSSVNPSVVRVDGTYIGSTPVTAWIDSGSHEVTFSYDRAYEHDLTFEVGHPVFLTWLIPRRQTVESGAVLSDIPAFRNYLESQFDQIVAWSSIIEFDDRYHRPPIFVQTAETAVQNRISGAESDLYEFFTQGLLYITSATMVEDYEASLHILTEHDLLPTEATDLLISTISRLKPLFSDHDTGSVRGQLQQVNAIDPVSTALPIPLDGVAPIAGVSFSGGETVVGRSDMSLFPGVHEMLKQTSVPPFSIASTEVSEYLWALFMRENPYWAKSNIAQLIADERVDEHYLAGLYPAVAVPSRQPIRNISWYAAQAFVEWLGTITGTTVFLPTQDQWEYAAQHDRSAEHVLSGSLWEFTSDSFAPLARFTEIPNTWESDQAGVIVKGGSAVSVEAATDRASIGVLDRSACSETTGFRIAWID